MKENSVMQFYSDMNTRMSFIFDEVTAAAVDEIEKNIRQGPFSIAFNGEKITVERWRSTEAADQFRTIINIGLHCIRLFGNVLTVNNASVIPHCLALSLLYLAYSGKAPMQLIDAGDERPDTKEEFVNALEVLYGCISNWECKVVNPIMADIGTDPNRKEQWYRNNNRKISRLIIKADPERIKRKADEMQDVWNQVLETSAAVVAEIERLPEKYGLPSSETELNLKELTEYKETMLYLDKAINDLIIFIDIMLEGYDERPETACPVSPDLMQDIF